MPNPESKIQTAIIRYLKSIPASYVLRPITCTEAGYPDRGSVVQC